MLFSSGSDTPQHAFEELDEAASGALEVEAVQECQEPEILTCCTREALYKILTNPCMIAIPVAVVCGLVAPLRRALFEEHGSVLQPLGSALETLTDPLLAINTIVMAASLFSSSDHDTKDGEDCNWQTILVFCLVRLVAIPAVGVTLMYLVKHICPELVGNTLMQLVILIQFGSTSAQSAIIVCQAAGSQRIAGMLAYLFMWQHLCAIVTLTGITMLALFVAIDAPP